MARCRVFEGISAYTETGEVWGEEFWSKLNAVFDRTAPMLYDTADGEEAETSGAGDDLASAKWNPSDRDDDLFDDEAARVHPCSVAARAYSEAAGRWLEAASAEWAVKEAELSAQAPSDQPGAGPQGAATIRVALDIIQWHRDQIWVKILRALSHPEEEDPESTFPKDSDGSAKVALLAIERSIAAWGLLMEHFPAHEREILVLLCQLYRLRQRLERAFPNAREFVRPWFDEGG
jgi:hypothetical protein